MADEKKLTNEEIKNEELTDEQANKAAGGTYHPFARCRDTCYLCGKSEYIENISVCGEESPTQAVCPGNRMMMAVTCEKDVALCMQMSDYAKYFGYEYDNLGKRRLKDVITEGKWHDAVCTNHYMLKKNGEKCGNCEWFGYCGGGCRALAMLDSAERTGKIDYFAADPVACLFFKGGWYDRVKERLVDFKRI